MMLVVLLIFLIPKLSYSSDCELPSSYDIEKEGLGQQAFPEEWQRELIALTALSRVEAAGALSLGTGNEQSGWKRLRASGIYEALLNMARLTNFTMDNKGPKEGGSSMWGIKSPDYFLSQSQYKRYKELSDRCQGQYWWQSKAALVMAARWVSELKGKSNYYYDSFYGTTDVVDAQITLRDDAASFQGNLVEGNRLLQRKLFEGGQPICQREARIAIAIDSYSFSTEGMTTVNRLIDDIRRFTPHSRISIRGTSKLVNGFAEGAFLESIPRLVENTNQKFFDVLDLVDSSIGDIEASESGSETLRARVLLIVSRFYSRHPTPKRPKELNDRMQTLSIEPFWVTLDGNEILYEDADLVPLLNHESFRAVNSAGDPLTARMVLHRLLRLVCQAPVAIPFGQWKVITTFDPSSNSIYDRIHLRYSTPVKATECREISFACTTVPVCRFSIFVHTRKYVSEYLNDREQKNVTLPFQWEYRDDFFTKYSDSVDSAAERHIVLVPMTAGTIAVRAFHPQRVIYSELRGIYPE